MEKMIVTIFNTEAAAYDGVSALKALNDGGDITLYATAVLAKDADGKVSVKQTSGVGVHGTAMGMLTGALIGLLAGPAGVAIGASLGGLTGMLVDLNKAGVDVRFVNQVSNELQSGKVAVIADVQEDWMAPIDTRMAALGGTVLRQPITAVIEDQEARDAAALSAEAGALKAELAAADDKSRIDVQKSIERVKTEASEKEAAIKAWVDQTLKDGEAKVAVVEAQLAKATTDTKARLEQRVSSLKASMEARCAKLRQAGDLLKQALT